MARRRVSETYRLDSLGSCSDSGATHFGAIFEPSFETSNKTRFSPVYNGNASVHVQMGPLYNYAYKDD